MDRLGLISLVTAVTIVLCLYIAWTTLAGPVDYNKPWHQISQIEMDTPLNASAGIIIETRTSDPENPETGRIWLRTDI